MALLTLARQDRGHHFTRVEEQYVLKPTSDTTGSLSVVRELFLIGPGGIRPTTTLLKRRHAEKMNFSKVKEPELRGPLLDPDATDATHPPLKPNCFSRPSLTLQKHLPVGSGSPLTVYMSK